MFEVSSLILSSQFWPPFKHEILELPSELQEEFNRHTKLYETYKGNRTLSWRSTVGRVNIEIQLTNRTIELMVLPVYAVIIWHFQNKCKFFL